MVWLDRGTMPLWHTTGNHTTYHPMSKIVSATLEVKRRFVALVNKRTGIPRSE
jgi:hypothetical protein